MRRRRLAVPMFVALAAALALAMPSPADAKVKPRPKVRADYSVFIMNDAQTVQSGGQAVYPVAVLPVGGFKGRLTFEVYGLPAGVSWRVLNLGGNQFDLVLNTQPGLPASSTVSLLAVRSTGKLKTAHFRLTMTAPPAPPVTAPPVTAPPVTAPPVTQPAAPNFGLRVDTPQAVNLGNQTAVFGITVDRSSGYNGPVQFGISGLPSGTSANFSPNPTVQSTNLYVTTTTATPAGTYTLPIVAQAGGAARAAYVTLVVQQQTDFTLSLSPSAITAPAGSTVQYLVDVRPTTANQRVTLSVSGEPRDTKSRLGANSVTGPTTLTLDTSRNTPAGAYTITVTGRSGNIVRTASAVLVVQNQPGFGLSANPATVVLSRTGAAPLAVTITRSGGFNGGVNLALAGLPAGVGYTAAVSQNTANITLYSANAAPGSYLVTITGSNGSLVASVQVQLLIQ